MLSITGRAGAGVGSGSFSLGAGLPLSSFFFLSTGWSSGGVGALILYSDATGGPVSGAEGGPGQQGHGAAEQGRGGAR